MRRIIPFLSAVLALAAPRLSTAQPVAPTRVLSLGKDEMLRGSITLPNHNTLLFFPTEGSNKVRVQALLPTGAPAWEATLTKAQVIRASGSGLLGGSYVPESSLITLLPMFLTSADNTVYSLEPIASGSRDPSQGLARHTLVVQAISETGRVVGNAFEVPPPPEKTERVVVTAFAQDGAVYALARESNAREQTSQLYLDRCDLRTGKLVQTALNLPAAADVRHADNYYLDWNFAGCRAGTCYFFRALKGADAKADAHRTPVEFEVKLLALADGHETGTFITRLHQNLPAQTYVQGNTSFPHHGLAHAPGSLAVGDTKRFSMLSGFSLETGGSCELVLDEATGDCLFTGQYAPEVPRPGVGDLPSLGTFVQRYTPTGTLVKAAIAPYAGVKDLSEELLSSRDYSYLSGMVLRSSLSPELLLAFYTKKGCLVSGYDAQLTPAPRRLVPFTGATSRAYFNRVYWSGPTCLQCYWHHA